MDNSDIRVGFWYSRAEPDLPMPVEMPSPWPGQTDFVLGLSRVEGGLRQTRYRGFSMCRICNRSNGSGEVEHAGFRWPSGLMHYVTAHNVRPDNDEFVALMQKRGRV